MRYHIEKEMTTFGVKGDVVVSTPDFYYFPKEQMIKTVDHLVHNFKLQEQKLFKVCPGDIIEGDDFKLTICDGNAIELDGEYKSTLLQTDTIETRYPDYPEYTNSPRIKKEASDGKVDLERIPEKDKDTSTSSLVKKLLPAMVGIVMAILMLWVRPRGIRGILMLVTTLVSFGISMFTLYTERRDGRAHNKLRKETYDEYLLTKRQELATLKLEERTSSNYNYLTLNDILVELDSHSSRLYERDIMDDDFLKLRLGTQTTEPSYNITNPFEKLELRYEEADEELKALYEEYSEISNMPLVTSAKHNIGLVGNRYVISKQMKNILMQSIFNHSPLDVQIIVITDDTYLDDYQYAFSMAHFKDSEKVHNYFVHNSITRDQYLNGFTQILRQRDMEYKPGMQFDKHMLFIIDNPALINNHPIREFLEKPEERLGMSQIQVAKASNELPKHIKTTINYKTETKAQLILEEGKLVNKEFILPQVDVSKNELEIYYRRLSNLEHIKGIKSSVPDKLGFLEMYEVNDPKQLQIANRWNKNKTYKSLAALLGKKSETDYIYLDLHEKIHGPHGLVAGTTGSGKSEVIQTYILSLAIEYSPEQVGFLLIDYKGGGMANLFKDMPHHLGSITNLDGYQSMRALASIKSELKRRQQIFSDNNVNHINNYTKLYETGQVQEPLPHLFLISDEFAELKAEQPDFMKELVSAARIGRSLGIHLILATQKPDGVVDDQIWSNSKFKLSLKVAEEADSKALLKTPDAAYITNPGRGYLKVGTNELYELFQSGYSGAPYSTNNVTSAKPEIYELDIYGNQTIINPDECATEQEQEGIQDTELDVVLQEIDNTYNTSNLTEVSKPWLPPLDSFVRDEVIVEPQDISLDLKVNIGVVDIPDKQSQEIYNVDLFEKGTQLIIGNVGMGKSTTIITMALKLAAQNCPSLLKYFILDFGNNGLIQLKNLKHTSEYITIDESKKHDQLIEYLTSEVLRRKQLMADANVSNFKLYNSKKNMQAIVIILDNYVKIEEVDTDFKDTIVNLVKEGAALGIYIISSVKSITEMRGNIHTQFLNTIVLSPVEKADISNTIGKTDYPISEIPGRAFVEWENIEVMQLNTLISNNEELYVGELTNLVEAINSKCKQENNAFVTIADTIEYKNYNLPQNKVYVGDLHTNQRPAIIDSTSIVIDGYNLSGKTNFVKLLIEQYRENNKICILDDSSYSLLEYSETENISYATDAKEIDFDADLVVINTFNRLDKLKPKESTPILERLFLMHLQGKKFIVENSGKGIEKRKGDFFTALQNSPYFAYLGLPTDQDLYAVNKQKYKKEEFTVKDAYIFSQKGINKVRLPKVVTGNEGKDFVIPELRDIAANNKFLLSNMAVLGNNYAKAITKLISDYPNKKFKVYDPEHKLELEINAQLIDLSNKEQVEKGDVIILGDITNLDNLAATDRRLKQEILNELDNIVVAVQTDKHKFICNQMKEAKKFKRYVVTGSFEDEGVLQVFKRPSRKMTAFKLTPKQVLEVNDKEMKTIKL